jgi:hypothetical protein
MRTYNGHFAISPICEIVILTIAGLLLHCWMPSTLHAQVIPQRVAQTTPSWSIIGPFPNIGGSGIGLKLSAEDPRDTSSSFLNLWGGQSRWHPYRGLEMLGWVNLTDHAPDVPCMFLARTYVYSPSTRAVRIELGVSGAARFYMNDSLLAAFDDDVFARNGSVTMACTLWKGWNRIHVRIGRDVMPFLSFALRITDSTGSDMADVTYATAPQTITKQHAPFQLLSRKTQEIDTTFQRDPRVVRMLRQAVLSDTLGPGHLRRAAWAAYNTSSLDTALLLARTALTVIQEDASLWLLKGLIYKAKGMADSANVFVERSLEIDPGSIQALRTSLNFMIRRNPLDEIPRLDIDSIAAAALRMPASDSFEIETVLLDMQQAVIFGSTSLQRITAVIRINSLDSLMKLPLPKRFGDDAPGWQKLTVLSGSGDQRVIDMTDADASLDGLTPGDVIVYSAERWQRDSLFTQFTYVDLPISPRVPTRRVRTSIIVPLTDNYSFNIRNYTPSQSEIETPSGMLFMWEAANVPAIVPESFMPPIADYTPRIDLSTSPGWWVLIRHMQSAFERRLQPCDQLRSVVDSLLPSDKKWSPDVVATRISHWVIKSITLQPQAGLSLPPNRACDVLALRSGTVADRVILASAMMAERGVEALPTLVKTNCNVSFSEPAVSMPFDHMILLLPGDTSANMIDLSFRTVPLGVVPPSIENAFAASISYRMRDPVRLPKRFMAKRSFNASTQMSFDTVGWITSRSQIRATDFDSTAIMMMARSFAPAGELSPDADVRHDSTWISSTKNEPFSPTCNIVLRNRVMADSTQDTITIRPRWMSMPSFPLLAMDAPSRTYPVILSASHDSVSSEVIITAPKGYTFAKPLPKGSFTLPSISYSISSTLKGQTLRLKRIVKVNSNTVLPSDYPAFRNAHGQMLNLDRMPIRLQRTSSGRRR